MEQQHNTDKSGNQGIPFMSTNSSIERYQKSKEEPLFSRPIVQDHKFSASEPPRFARPYSGHEDLFYCEDIKDASKSSGKKQVSKISEFIFLKSFQIVFSEHMCPSVQVWILISNYTFSVLNFSWWIIIQSGLQEWI